MDRALMLGNHAIARGAWEGGVHFATGYPGTPSTEILEALATYPEVETRWSTNEKVAFAEGMGASIGGLRVLVSMKQVGLNVAADAFMIFPYAGVNGGFVLVSADDPGMHSSQTEQDSRYLAQMAKVPVLEPSDAQECKDFLPLALDLSERFQTPVMLRITTRLAHHKGLVRTGARSQVPRRPYDRTEKRYAPPFFRHQLRPELERRLLALERYAQSAPVNFEVAGGGEAGVITCGVAYNYVREVLPQADVLRLGMTFPLPEERLRAFCSRYPTVYVVEEGEPFIETHLKALEMHNVVGKEVFGLIGEYSPARLREALGLGTAPRPLTEEVPVPARTPTFCVGCGHRTVFSVLRQLRVTVCGDIGCYSMGSLPPYETCHTTFCMGASIGVAFGLERAGERAVALIGDSTFLHTGLPALVDAVYHRSRLTLLILDNGATAMTGCQPNPASGRDITGAAAPRIDFEALCRAMGVPQVETVDTWDRQGLLGAARRALAFDGPAVVVVRGPCQQLPEMKAAERVPYAIDTAACTLCEACYRAWCPALRPGPDGYPRIDPSECTACSLCAQYCPFGAIVQEASVS